MGKDNSNMKQDYRKKPDIFICGLFEAWQLFTAVFKMEEKCH